MKRNILLALAIMLTGSVMAQSKMDAYSKMTLEGMRSDKATYAKSMVKADSTGEDAVRAFVTVKNEAAMAKLRQMGVELGYGNGHVTTATIPMSVIDSVLEMDDVTNLHLSQPMEPLTDAVRSFSHVADVHQGNGLDRPYKGKGVIYGTVENGVDFQHAAFKDENGKSRIMMAYLPKAQTKLTGAQENYPVTLGDYSTTLKGYVYDNNNLSELTTGNVKEFHGTMTASIAAGSAYGDELYYGMAPEANMILIDCPEMDEATIIDGIALVFSEAEKRGMPAVVNLSQGNYYGPHSSSSATELLNSMTGPGRIITVASGNEGAKNMWINKPAGETIKTRLLASSGAENVYPFVVFDIWGKDNKPCAMKLYARNIRTNELDELYNSAKGMKERTIFSMKYFKIGMGIAEVSHTSDNYNLNLAFLGVQMRDGYELVLELSGESEVDAWANGVNFTGEEGTEYLAGSPDMSFNVFTCFDNAISVGSYTTKNTFVWLGDGQEYHWDPVKYAIGKVTYDSSYGIDRDGRSVPTVIAPGAWVISAGSNYCDKCKLTDDHNDNIVKCDDKDGRKQPYLIAHGTSLAAPVVAGIIALWLEQNPTLTPQDVKNILAMTSVKDELLAGDEKRVGYGKIDALAGMKNIPAEIINKVKGTQPVIMAAHNGFSVLSPKADAKVEVFNAAGQRVMSATAKGGATQSFSLNESGMFIVKVGAAVKKIML